MLNLARELQDRPAVHLARSHVAALSVLHDEASLVAKMSAGLGCVVAHVANAADIGRALSQARTELQSVELEEARRKRKVWSEADLCLTELDLNLAATIRALLASPYTLKRPKAPQATKPAKGKRGKRGKA